MRLRFALIPKLPPDKPGWAAGFLRPPDARSGKQILKHLLRTRFILTLFALIGLSMLLGHAWVFAYPGVRSQEIMQAAIPPVSAEYTRVIRITTEDYHNIFQDLITPEPLDRAIDGILQFQPALVVLDLDTSARRFSDKLKPRSNVVWARDAEEDVKGELVNLLPVRGKMDSSGVSWGLGLFARGPDWSIRDYARTIAVGSTQQPSLHWKTVVQFCAIAASASVTACKGVETRAQGLDGQAEHDGGHLTVPIRHARYQFEPWSLSDIIPAGTRVSGGGDSAKSDLMDKIVLLGGSYSPQDRHQTPFGVLDGVEVVASAVEAELNPQGFREMGWGAAVGLKIVLALLIALIHHSLRPFYAMFSTTILLAFLIFFGSLTAAFFAGYRADYVPFLLGILLEQLYTSAEVAEHQMSEMERVRGKQ